MSTTGVGRSLRSTKPRGQTVQAEARSGAVKRKGRSKSTLVHMKENKRQIVDSLDENIERITLESTEILDETSRDGDYTLDRKHSLRSWSTKTTKPSPIDYLASRSSFTFSNIFFPAPHGRSPLPQLSWGDASEVWDAMLVKDRTYKRDPLYLRRHPSLQPRMRTILLDWIVEVCEVYRLHKETYHLVVDYVDRYLSYHHNMAKQRLQLVGITALFIASKLEEIYPPKLSEFAYVTDGACTEKEILLQEIIMLQTLDWKLSPVTPNCWLSSYLQIASRLAHPSNKENVPQKDFEFPNYTPLDLIRVSQLIDLCLLDTGCLQFSYSIVAASCIYHILPLDVSLVTGHKWEELYPCVQWLAPFAKTVRELPPAQIKYFDKVSDDDAHNIQVHRNGIGLLDVVKSHLNDCVPVNIINRASPIKCDGMLTPPASTKKNSREVIILK